MENKTLILTITLGEYEDRHTTVLAVSKDQGKLESYREEHMAKRALKKLLNDEYQKELKSLEQINPFPEEAPEKLSKPAVPPRTKEEHAARCKLKQEHHDKYQAWSERYYAHQEQLKLAAKEMVLVKHDLKGLDFEPRGFYYGYESIPSENQYDIFEVREL